MRVPEILKKTDNKYDSAIRTFYLLFLCAGLIIAVAVGVTHMTAAAWVLGSLFALLGAIVYATIAKLIIDMVRKDRTVARPDILIRLFYVVFFSLATVAFVAIGMQHRDTKTWIIAFVGSYGAAVIYSAIAHLIITLARKDKPTTTP